MSLTMTFRGRCEHPAGSVDLARYPNLAHSPDRGVFTHLAGISVDRVVKSDRACATTSDLDDMADGLGITFDELLDALRYARAAGQI